MSRRPDPFNQASLEAALHELGCPESVVPTVISNYRLFIPILFANLGEDEILEIVCHARVGLGLGEQETAWRSSIKYLVAWAQNELNTYRVRRGLTAVQPSPEPSRSQQPRLF